MLNKIIEEENSKSIKMKEELLTNISKYLNNFTNVQTASLKNSFGKVYDSIKENVDYILFFFARPDCKLSRNIYLYLTLKYLLNCVERLISQLLRV